MTINKICEKDYLLDRAGVDQISAELENRMQEAGVRKENAVRLRFTAEEMLLNICEHFDEKMTVTLRISKRFGTPIFRFIYKGEKYNPTNAENEEDDPMTQALLRMGMLPEWNYRRGMNELILRVPREAVKSELQLVIALVLAVVFGLLYSVIPSQISSNLLDYLLVPVSDTFMNALNTFAGMMIFLSILSGICSVEKAADFSKMGRYVIMRFMVGSFLGIALGIGLLFPFFHFSFGTVQSGNSQISDIMDMIFSIIPSNPITPFMEGNMLQITFMAIIVGMAFLVTDSKTKELKKLVIQLNDIVMQIVSMICKWLPVFVFASLTALWWKNGADIFIRLWKPVLFYALVCSILLAAKALFAKNKLHISLRKFFSAVKKNMITGLLTASSSAAFASMLDDNEKKLGIAPEFNRFALPFAHMLECTEMGIAFAVIMFYLSEYYNTPVNFGWFVTVWLMCSVFSVTIPPVSGGAVICLGLLMAQLNVPMDGLAVAGILAITLNFWETFTGIGTIHLELMLQADHLNMLDKDILEN